MELEPVSAALRGITEGTAATVVRAEAERQPRRAPKAEKATEG
jgi:hypothetical protein